MQSYLKKYRPFLVFLAKFFLTYLILGLGYRYYLSTFDASFNQIDDITTAVAHQSETVLRWFGANASTLPHEKHPYHKLFISGDYVARIIEGCNAVSVMILFVSFVAAFSGTLARTIVFAVTGCLTIHILNVVRIAILAAAIHRFPQHEHFLHGVVFPMFIYGVVFLLWVIWVNKFSYYSDVKK